MLVATSNWLAGSKGERNGMGSLQTPLRGPGWADVRVYAEELGNRWGGYFVLTIRLAKGRGGRTDLWVVCERFGMPDKSGIPKVRRSGHVYPCSDGLTMPALMHGLLADVDRMLEDDAGLATRQATF